MEIIQCSNCKRSYIPPKYVCPKCGVTHFIPKLIEGKGKIDSFTTIWIASEQYGDQIPYNLVIIKLDEGLRITARLLDNKENMAIGSTVAFEEKNNLGYIFRLDS